jgi:hypothetical protein
VTRSRRFNVRTRRGCRAKRRLQAIRSKRKIMRLKFAIGFAALTVGAALASVPAVAQQQGVSGYSRRGAVVAIYPY